MSGLPRVDIDQPRWDQSTYAGRAKHFFVQTNPLNLLVTPRKLDEAKEIVQKYKANQPLPPGTTMEDVWKAKYLYNSAFHPETGEKVFFLGRMSCQVPANVVLTGALMTFYKTTRDIVFWQWVNQSFNACVNYSNRSGGTISVKQLSLSYVLATSAAVATSIGVNRTVSKFPELIKRWVPFMAVAAANCVNIPMMRSNELMKGIPLFDANNNRVGQSRKMAREGISQVVLSRVSMAIPTMIFLPVLVDHMEKKGMFKNKPNHPLYLNLVGCAILLVFATPLCCAIFSQKVTVSVSRLETDVQDAIKKQNPSLTEVWYNKGL